MCVCQSNIREKAPRKVCTIKANGKLDQIEFQSRSRHVTRPRLLLCVGAIQSRAYREVSHYRLQHYYRSDVLDETMSSIKVHDSKTLQGWVLIPHPSRQIVSYMKSYLLCPPRRLKQTTTNSRPCSPPPIANYRGWHATLSHHYHEFQAPRPGVRK
jgi:hypothetical protein